MTSSQSHQRRCYIATRVFPPSLTSLWMLTTFCLSDPCLPTTCTLEISTDPSGIWSISAKTSSGVSFRGFSESWMPSLGLCAPVCCPLRGTCGRGRKWKSTQFLNVTVTGHCCHSWHANTPAQKILKVLFETLWVSSNPVISSPHCTLQQSESQQQHPFHISVWNEDACNSRCTKGCFMKPNPNTTQPPIVHLFSRLNKQLGFEKWFGENMPEVNDLYSISIMYHDTSSLCLVIAHGFPQSPCLVSSGYNGQFAEFAVNWSHVTTQYG